MPLNSASLNSEFFEELELLILFNSDTTREGLKIHHEAAPARVAAAKRLFAKDMISQQDGGYLTGHGVDAAEHAHALVSLLSVQ